MAEFLVEEAPAFPYTPPPNQSRARRLERRRAFRKKRAKILQAVKSLKLKPFRPLWQRALEQRGAVRNG